MKLTDYELGYIAGVLIQHLEARSDIVAQEILDKIIKEMEGKEGKSDE